MPITRPFRRLATLGTAAAVCALIPLSLGLAQNGDQGKVGTREQKTQDVDWDELHRAEAQRGRLSLTTGELLEAPPMVADVSREELNKANLPILLPDDGQMIENMRLFTKKNFYVASFRDDAHTVQITGTRISQGTLGISGASERMATRSDEEGYIYQQSEYGCDLSFTRYNVSYNISVECKEPESDRRCTGKDYAMGLARSLVYVGGVPERDDNPDGDGENTPQ